MTFQAYFLLPHILQFFSASHYYFFPLFSFAISLLPPYVILIRVIVKRRFNSGIHVLQCLHVEMSRTVCPQNGLIIFQGSHKRGSHELRINLVLLCTLIYLNILQITGFHEDKRRKIDGKF